jgi:molybdopterin-guanine dinucleotide biosynthesis protein A
VNDRVGVVLAGGRSSRMGRDKAALVVGGQTLARRAADVVAAVAAQVLIADRGRGLVPGAASVADGPGRGPAAGLLGAARAAPGRPLLVLACDLPAVPASLLAALAERVEPADPAPGATAAAGASATAGPDLVLPRWARGIEPLVGWYGPRALAALAAQVTTGEYSLGRLVERADLAVAWLEGEALESFGDPEELFRNVNTPEDLDRIRHLRP